MDKVAIFIDSGYLDKLLKNEFRSPQIDLGKLARVLSSGRELLRSYYYYCMPFQSTHPTPYEKELYIKKQKYIHALSKIPRLELRQGRLAKFPDGHGGFEFKQKRIDVMMASDLIRLSATGKINEAVLITGDSDFVPAIKEAKDLGVVVKLYYSPNAINAELLLSCDERIEIKKDLIETILL